MKKRSVKYKDIQKYSSMSSEIKWTNKRYTLLEIKSMKKNQIEILDLKNSRNEMRNTLEGIRNRVDQMEQRIIKLKDRNL